MEIAAHPLESCAAQGEILLKATDPTPITTTLLLERLRDRADQDAWSEFDDRFRRVILAAALRLGLPRPDADEAAQETMLQAFRDYQQGKYDRSKGRLSSWLIAIAHHRIIDIQRKRGRDRRNAPDDQIDTIPHTDVEHAFDAALERIVFESAWSWLLQNTNARDDALRAFELTTMRGVPIPEAASQCAMTVDQVYVARSRVAARLCQAVERFETAYRDGL